MSDASDATSKGADFLGKKIGPFTAQTWIIIAGGGAIVVYMIIRKRNAGSTPLTTDSFTNPNADSISSQAGGSSSGTVNTANGTPNTFTNAQWALNASNGLIAGGDDPTTVSNALSKYMNGQSLSAAEAAIVAVAITTYGEPPQGVLPVTTGGSTTPPNSTGDGSDPVTQLIVNGAGWFAETANGIIQNISGSQLQDYTAQGVQKTSAYSSYAQEPNGDVYGQLAYAMNGQKAGDWVYISSNDLKGLLNSGTGPVNPTRVLTPPTSTAGQAHTYTTLPGDTLTNLSQRFLGTSDTTAIRSSNPGVNDPLSVGTVLKIPTAS